MNPLSHVIAEGRVDELVLLDPGLPLEDGRDHERLEVIPRTRLVDHVDVDGRQGLLDALPDLFHRDHGS